MKNKVLVFFANAPPSLREMLNRILQSENYETLWAASDREVLELLQDQWPDLLLLDFNRSLKRAMNTLKQLQAVNAFVPVILVAEQRAEFAHAEAGRVAALIRKPFAVSLLLQIMRDVLNPLPEAAQPDAQEQHAHSSSP